jgi:hypothetical protein
VEAFMRLPEAKRNQVVRQVVILTLRAYELTHATATVTKGGTAAVGYVTPSEVCRITPKTVQTMAGRIRKGAPPLKHLRIMAAGQPLASYIAAHCKTPKLPAGPGRVIYRKSGTGFFITPAFTIKAAHWTLAYQSDGGHFQVLVSKDSQYQPVVVAADGPAAGTKPVSGPGSFRLSIGSSVGWKIEVREGP